MVIFHSYVSLPEGIIIIRISQKGTIKTWDSGLRILRGTGVIYNWFITVISTIYIHLLYNHNPHSQLYITVYTVYPSFLFIICHICWE